MLCQKRLKELLDYSPATGDFAWRVSNSNRRKIGSKAGCAKSDGYIVIRLDNQLYRTARLAWLYMTGMWPINKIDHINTNRSDNRWVNLRLATNEINSQNLRKAQKNNSTGFLGVSPSEWGFRAQIKRGPGTKYLGTFETPEEAHSVYLEAKRRLHEGCTI